MKAAIKFGDEKVKSAFTKIAEGNSEEQQLFKQLNNAFEKIESNHAKGKKIQKRLWPKEYQEKYAVDNLWKLNLPGGWRLIYTIKANDIIILAIILEWLKHKDYEKRFNYKKN